MREVVRDLARAAANGPVSSFFPSAEMEAASARDIEALVAMTTKRLALDLLIEWLAEAACSVLYGSSSRAFVELRELIARDPRLSELFVVTPLGVTFAPTVPPEEQREISAFIQGYYRRGASAVAPAVSRQRRCVG